MDLFISSLFLYEAIRDFISFHKFTISEILRYIRLNLDLNSPACFSSLSLTLQLIQGALSTNRMGKVEDR